MEVHRNEEKAVKIFFTYLFFCATHEKFLYNFFCLCGGNGKMKLHVHFYVYARLKYHQQHIHTLYKYSIFSLSISLRISDWHCKMTSIKI